MKLVDRNGNPVKPKTTSFGLYDAPPILDHGGRILNPSPIQKMWAKALQKEMETPSYFKKFMGCTIVDRFGNSLKYVREGKGNLIETQEDKIKMGIRCPLNSH